MQVKITRTTIADCKVVKAGQVYDLPDADARTLLQLGKAELVTVEAEPAPQVLDTTEAAAVIDTEAPKAKRGRRAK